MSERAILAEIVGRDVRSHRRRFSKAQLVFETCEIQGFPNPSKSRYPLFVLACPIRAVVSIATRCRRRYRHSRQLNELARSIALLSSPEALPAQLPQHVGNEGFSAVLGKALSEPARVASWLGKRIHEIQTITGSLPSIAILVKSEEDIGPTAVALNDALAAQNIRAVACPGGLVVGQENDVRVFDVQHIKGLEFEAVFFVDVDGLAAQEPELFDKYLYVGATRAAMFLGLTVSGQTLPVSIGSITEQLQDRWL